MTKKLYRYFSLFFSVVLMSFFCLFGSVRSAEALSLGDWLGAAAYVASAKSSFNYYDGSGRHEMLKEYQKETGVSKEPQANEMLKNIMSRLSVSVQKNEGLKQPFNYYVTPEKDLNAFCGIGRNMAVNIGTFEKLNYNEDEIAFIVAHEMGHGQGNHLTNQFNKTMTLSVATYLYNAANDNNFTKIMSYIANRQILAKGFTLPNEWDADNRSFRYATAANYNPGAGAAAFVRLRSIYGDQGRSFFGDILSPQDHPTTPDRIKNFSQKLTEYSYNNVTVTNNGVYIRGKLWLRATKTAIELPEERAFLIAGKLAQIFHHHQEELADAIDGQLVINDTVILTAVGREDAEVLATLWNEWIIEDKQ